MGFFIVPTSLGWGGGEGGEKWSEKIQVKDSHRAWHLVGYKCYI